MVDQNGTTKEVVEKILFDVLSLVDSEAEWWANQLEAAENSPLSDTLTVLPLVGRAAVSRTIYNTLASYSIQYGVSLEK